MHRSSHRGGAEIQSWAPVIDSRRIRAAALRLVLETFTELLRFFLKLWLPPDVFAFRAEAPPWYGNAFSMLRVLQATPNRNEITMRIYLITSECLYNNTKVNDEHFFSVSLQAICKFIRRSSKMHT